MEMNYIDKKGNLELKMLEIKKTLKIVEFLMENQAIQIN